MSSSTLDAASIDTVVVSSFGRCFARVMTRLPNAPSALSAAIAPARRSSSSSPFAIPRAFFARVTTPSSACSEKDASAFESSRRFCSSRRRACSLTSVLSATCPVVSAIAAPPSAAIAPPAARCASIAENKYLNEYVSPVRSFVAGSANRVARRVFTGAPSPHSSSHAFTMCFILPRNPYARSSTAR